MQQFVSISSTDTLTNSRQELLNNDCTIMSNSSGTSFPTTNLQQGMFCFRTDLYQLFQLKDLTPTWIMVFDLSQVATNKAYVDNQISSLAASTVATSQVVTTAMANKILQLNASGQLPASITGNAATATNVAWSGVTGTPSTYTPPIATVSVLGGVKQGSNVTIAGDGTISVAAPAVQDGKQLFASSGTFTVPTGVTQVWVTLCGGGGGAGGAGWNGSAGAYAGGGGGGAVYYSQYSVTGLTGGQTITVTVGAGGTGGGANSAGNQAGTGGTGGTSSFGAYVSASGGTGGTGGWYYNNSSGSGGGGGNLTNLSYGNGTIPGGTPYPPYGFGGAGSANKSNGVAGSAGVALVEW